MTTALLTAPLPALDSAPTQEDLRRATADLRKARLRANALLLAQDAARVTYDRLLAEATEAHAALVAKQAELDRVLAQVRGTHPASSPIRFRLTQVVRQTQA